MYLKKLLKLESSIQWCEGQTFKYMYSDYIAEFWNSITGIFLCIVAIYCYRKNKKHLNKKICQELYISNVLLFIVGIGTILFHGTLLYIWQICDEIPMLLLVIEYNKLLSKLYNIPFSLHIYKCIPIIIFSYYINPSLQIILFQSIFTIYIIFIYYYCYFINSKFNKLLKLYQKISVMILIFSLIIWNIDNNFCNYSKHFKLHALWHITTSIGMYYCNEIMGLYIILRNDELV